MDREECTQVTVNNPKQVCKQVPKPVKEVGVHKHNTGYTGRCTQVPKLAKEEGLLIQKF